MLGLVPLFDLSLLLFTENGELGSILVALTFAGRFLCTSFVGMVTPEKLCVIRSKLLVTL